MSADLRLFDLAGADDDLRFSPNCWRTRLALAHKELPVETIAWRFTEKNAIAKSDQGKVPVLVAGDKWLYESWDIAEYLEDTYPDRSSLFGCPQGRATARFVNQWASEVLHPAVARVVVPDIPAVLHEKDKDYFRTTREAAFGRTFEVIAAERGDALAVLNRTLAPLRSTVSKQPFVAGAAPAYADHAVFGAFQWARVISSAALLEDNDPVSSWVERMLDAYDGLARSAKRMASA
ncbi:glutathione S-transferase family protein [Acidiphilium sp. PM]|uniref:glutathione S-transferase family protein n=1 Tax=Acidiphilium sp. PM TaxID=1043206 RepID=UPI0002144F69|nr:glutathione S-transferase family protein [Acidiphilium sp. PM]EGO93307.1 Glutathione S-transferase domain-containing protein [Acidiphilium sp. PM]